MQEAENKSLDRTGFPNIEGLEIIERLGKGAMGEVFKARQVNLNRIVAVKILNAKELGEQGVLRFQSEAKNTANLNHPNLLRVYSAGVNAEQLYLVMEYLEGRSLDSILESKDKSISRKQLGRLICDLLSGLDYAHKCGFIHRDLKPANIMIVGSPGEPQAKIVDFGIAKALGEDAQKLTSTGALLGSPAYMSPEQCLGREIDLRSDIYSMACVIYEVFSETLPYTAGNTLELMYKHINAPVPSEEYMKNFCGPKLAELLSEALSKSPEDRPSTAGRMRDSMERALDSLPDSYDASAAKAEKSKAKEEPRPSPALTTAGNDAGAPAKKSNPTMLVIVIGIIVALGLGFYVFVSKQKQDTPKEIIPITAPGLPSSAAPQAHFDLYLTQNDLTNANKEIDILLKMDKELSLPTEIRFAKHPCTKVSFE